MTEAAEVRTYFLTCHGTVNSNGKLVRKGCGVIEQTGKQMEARHGSFVCPVCFASEWPHGLSIAGPNNAGLDALLAEPTGEIPMDEPPKRRRPSRTSRQAPLL